MCPLWIWFTIGAKGRLSIMVQVQIQGPVDNLCCDVVLIWCICSRPTYPYQLQWLPMTCMSECTIIWLLNMAGVLAQTSFVNTITTSYVNTITYRVEMGLLTFSLTAMSIVIHRTQISLMHVCVSYLHTTDKLTWESRPKYVFRTRPLCHLLLVFE